MTTTTRIPPVVLIIAGNDPSGGAGICADTQAVTALHCHPAPVISCLTVQDTVNAYAVEPMPAKLVRDQAEAVLADMPVAAIKLGLLGTAEFAREVSALLAAHPGIPVVTDPVLVAAGGARLAAQDIAAIYLEQLLPRSSVLTPNAAELRALAGDDGSREDKARRLLEHGPRWVLAKGGDEDTEDVRNLLVGETDNYEWSWVRTAGEHHGSGCTLAASIAARIALGDDIPAAVEAAQRFTQRAIAEGWQLGRGQRIPARR